MRCKCCDSKTNVKFRLDDFYCNKCSRSISFTIAEDRDYGKDNLDNDEEFFKDESG